MYLMIVTGLYLAFSVCNQTKHLENMGTFQRNAVKRVLRYMIAPTYYGIGFGGLHESLLSVDFVAEY